MASSVTPSIYRRSSESPFASTYNFLCGVILVRGVDDWDCSQLGVGVDHLKEEDEQT